MSTMFGNTATGNTASAGAFVFPGSARNQSFSTSNESSPGFSYTNNNNNHHHQQGENYIINNNNGNELFESPIASSSRSASSKKQLSTPIENPLLFRTSSSSLLGSDRNNYQYDYNNNNSNIDGPLTPRGTQTKNNSVVLQPFGTSMMNNQSCVSSALLLSSSSSSIRQRKGFTFEGNGSAISSSTPQGMDSSVTGTTTLGRPQQQQRRVLPPRASYSLGTHNKTNYQQQQQQQQQQPNNNQIVSTSTKSSSNNNSVFLFGTNETTGRYNNSNNKPNLHVTTLSSTRSTDTISSSSPHNMYSPSQVSLLPSTTTPWDNSRIGGVGNGGFVGSTTWVFVFGAIVSQSSSLYDEIIHQLSEFGQIISHRGRSNWIAVQYHSEIEAEKAACHRRMKFYTGTDTVYVTIQRLLPSDPEMTMVLQTQQGSSSTGLSSSSTNLSSINTYSNSIMQQPSTNIWTSNVQKKNTENNKNTNTSVAIGRIDSDGGLLLTGGNRPGNTDECSVDTMVISNKRSNESSSLLNVNDRNSNAEKNQQYDDDDGLIVNVVPRRLIVQNPDVHDPNIINRPNGDSICIKFLKWFLDIEEDE